MIRFGFKQLSYKLSDCLCFDFSYSDSKLLVQNVFAFEILDVTDEVFIDHEGRVLRINFVTGEIGTICTNHWDDVDASVLCRHLGISSMGWATSLPRDYHYNRTVFGVYCFGNETNALDCPAETNDTAQVCDTMNDAAVKCHYPHTSKGSFFLV